MDKPSIHKFIASLVTTYQLSPEDWDLGPMTKKNWREINKRTNDHNESLKIVATSLKHLYETRIKELEQQNEALKKALIEKTGAPF